MGDFRGFGMISRILSAFHDLVGFLSCFSSSLQTWCDLMLPSFCDSEEPTGAHNTGRTCRPHRTATGGAVRTKRQCRCFTADRLEARCTPMSHCGSSRMFHCSSCIADNLCFVPLAVHCLLQFLPQQRSHPRRVMVSPCSTGYTISGQAHMHTWIT